MMKVAAERSRSLLAGQAHPHLCLLGLQVLSGGVAQLQAPGESCCVAPAGYDGGSKR